jgi:hydroxymethylpyrimidine/phosphomethylpyrimidine kinase
MTPTLPQCLTIAGSDSGGGAGIQADLKTFQANGTFGMSVLTSITAQNTLHVTRAYDLPEDLILAQLQAVFDDFSVASVKTGMLSSKGIVSTVSAFWRSLGPSAPPLVVDPVMISKSGYPLLQLDAVARVRRELLPLATVVTPNSHEAELLSGVRLAGRDEVEAAGWKILALGPKSVLLKGGHLVGKGLDPSRATDYLFADGKVREFSSPRVETTSTHGTGCTYSAAISAWLGRGYAVHEAVARAKRYLDGAIRLGLDIGHGHGPTHHFFFMTDWMKAVGGAAAKRRRARKAAAQAALALTAREPAGKRLAAMPPAAKQPAAKQPAAKRPAAKQPAAKQPAAKQPAAKRPAAKRPAAKRPAVKPPAAKRPTAKEAATGSVPPKLSRLVLGPRTARPGVTKTRLSR